MRVAPGMAATASLASAFALAGCATSGPDFRTPGALVLGVPNEYVGSGRNETKPEDLAVWWRGMNDPVLDRLIVDGVARNLDLDQAAAQLRQAREALVQARSDRVPTANASGGVQQNLDSDFNRSTNLSIGADASWQADLFGGVSRSIEAARADYGSVAFNLGAVRVAIVSEIASNYVQVRLAQRRLATARETLALSDENLEIAGFRVQAGLVSSLDVEQARTERAQNAATIPAIEQDFAQAAYRIAVLTARAPGELLPLLRPAKVIPVGPADVGVGVPADTLRQRPDVRSAERALAAATARIGVAEAQLRPNLVISGDIGTSALSIGGLLDGIAGSLLAGITVPLFDGGRLRSLVRAQEAATDGAFALYRETVLVALEEVENGLVALTAAKQRRAQFDIALEAADNSALLARSLYRSGLTDFRTLLDSERSLVSAREGVDSSAGEQGLAVVQLYVALGGGWNSSSPPASRVAT